MCKCMHIYIHIEMHIFTGTHMPNMDICGNTGTKQTYRNVHTGSHIHTLTYTYMHIFTQIHIHLQVLYIVYAE